MGIFDILNTDPLDKDISKYEKLTSKNPENANMRNTLGDLYFKKGMIEKAAQRYMEAVTLYLKFRQQEKAVAVVKKSISHYSIDIKNIEAMLSEMQAKGLKKEIITLYVQLAKQKQNINRTLANDIFSKILQLDPDNEDALSFFEKSKQLSKSIGKGSKHLNPLQRPSPEAVSQVPDRISSDEKKKIDIKIPDKPQGPTTEINADSVTPDKMKDKFLAIAKEKRNLENIILQQNDMLKKLEKEKSDNTQNLKQYAENNKKMKEKLIDFDMLRNEEISDLKKQIERLLQENKKQMSEKDLIFKNLDRDQQNISFTTQQLTETLTQEKLELETLLSKANKELKDKDSFIDSLKDKLENITANINQLTKEKEELTSKIILTHGSIDELHNLIEEKVNEIREVKQERDELSLMKQERTQTEEELNQKILTYEKELSELNTDIDEITLSMEEKVKENEETKERVSLLEQQLTLKENEMNESVSSLTEELLQKDKLLTERAEVYESWKEELMAKTGEFETARDRLEEENRGLYAELEETKSKIAEYTSLYEESDRDKKEFDEQLSVLKQQLTLKENEMNERESSLTEELLRKNKLLTEIPGSQEKTEAEEELNQKILTYDQEISELKTDIDEITLSMEEKVKENKETKERVSLLEQQLTLKENEMNESVSSLTEELLQRDKLLTERAEVYESEKEELMAKTGEFETARDRLEEENIRLHTELDDIKNKVSEFSSSFTALYEESERDKKEFDEQLSVLKQQLTLKENEMNERESSLTEELLQKDKLLTEKAEVYESGKEELMAKTGEFETARDGLEEENRGLHAELEETKSKIAEYTRLYEESDRDKKELEEQFSEALNKILDLENVNEKHLYEISSKEQFFSELKKKHDSGLSELTGEVESLKSENKELKERTLEKEEAIKLIVSEKNGLKEKLAASDSALDTLQNENNNEMAGIKEQIESASLKISDLEISLENSNNENIALRKKLEETHEGVYEGEEKVKAPFEMAADKQMPSVGRKDRDLIIFKKKRSWISYAISSAVLIILIVSAMTLFKVYIPKLSTPRPPDLQIVHISYDDIFDRMTRFISSEKIKFQATMITELLKRKENSGKDLSQFDFNRFFYFKVNINSLKGALSQDLFKNPVASIQLIDGERTFLPAEDVKVKGIKTIYRGKEPVSIVFLYAFPKNNIKSDLKNLMLLLSHNNDEMRLSWDIPKLTAEKLIN
jgi:chromosome segregation ATPase